MAQNSEIMCYAIVLAENGALLTNKSIKTIENTKLYYKAPRESFYVELNDAKIAFRLLHPELQKLCVIQPLAPTGTAIKIK